MVGLVAGQNGHADEPGETIDGDVAAVRARLAKKLSPDELARLDELERQRIAYAAQDEYPATGEQIEAQHGEQVDTGTADLERAVRPQVDEAPRRRRKKEPAIA